MSNQEILQRIRPIIAKQLDVEPVDVKMSANLTHDLGADSLDALELRIAVEREFNIRIPDEDTMNIFTVGDAVNYIHQRISPDDAPKNKRPNTKTQTRVYFGAPGYDSLLCGYLPNDKIYDYLKNLSKQNLSQQHCACYGFSFTGCPYDGHLKQTLILDASIEDGFTSVYGLNPLCGVRTVHGCFRKLKKGECKDPFVVENVGKVFWPDKYGKQR